MIKKLFFYLFILFFATTAITSIAQENNSTEEIEIQADGATTEITTLNTNENDDGEDEDLSDNEDEDSVDDVQTLNAKKTNIIQEKKEEFEQKRERIKIQAEEKKEEFEQKREDAQNRLEEKKDEMKQKREKIKERLTEKRKEIISAYAERMAKRLEAALNRLSKLTDRIESRIEKLSENFDTTESLLLIDDVRIRIDSLHNDISIALVEVQDAFGAEDPKTAFENTRALIKEIVVEIKEIHKTLVDIVSKLKAQIASGISKKPAETEGTSTE